MSQNNIYVWRSFLSNDFNDFNDFKSNLVDKNGLLPR